MQPSCMRAIQYRAYGGPEVLKLVHLQEPTPGKNQVSIRVSSASVNPVDWKRMSGAFRLIVPVTFPMVPGHDVAGNVIAEEDQPLHPDQCVIAAHAIIDDHRRVDAKA